MNIYEEFNNWVSMFEISKKEYITKLAEFKKHKGTDLSSEDLEGLLYYLTGICIKSEKSTEIINNFEKCMSVRRNKLGTHPDNLWYNAIRFIYFESLGNKESIYSTDDIWQLTEYIRRYNRTPEKQEDNMYMDILYDLGKQ